MCDVSVFGIPQAIDTPCTTACCRDVEEYEAIERREFAAIEQRKEAPRAVGIKVGDRGHAGENECDGPREQADDQESTANQLKDPCGAAHRHGRCVAKLADRQVQLLRGSVLQ